MKMISQNIFDPLFLWKFSCCLSFGLVLSLSSILGNKEIFAVPSKDDMSCLSSFPPPHVIIIIIINIMHLLFRWCEWLPRDMTMMMMIGGRHEEGTRVMLLHPLQFAPKTSKHPSPKRLWQNITFNVARCDMCPSSLLPSHHSMHHPPFLLSCLHFLLSERQHLPWSELNVSLPLETRCDPRIILSYPRILRKMLFQSRERKRAVYYERLDIL